MTNTLYKRAWWLSIITIGYNIVEGLISTLFGAEDDTLALLGFGIDSFVEVISGIGIAHMIWRLNKNPVESKDRFERLALRITGSAFFLLAIGLMLGAGLDILQASKPQSTLAGIIISLVSLLTMYFLFKEKLRVGRALNSPPIISDANCTKTCFYLSFILLGSSAIYEMFKVPYIDATGSLGIAWYALKEGKEALEKSKNP